MLDALVIVEMDVTVDQIVCFAKKSRFMPLETFNLEDGEEVFGHCIVIGISPS